MLKTILKNKILDLMSILSKTTSIGFYIIEKIFTT